MQKNPSDGASDKDDVTMYVDAPRPRAGERFDVVLLIKLLLVIFLVAGYFVLLDSKLRETSGVVDSIATPVYMQPIYKTDLQTER